MRHLLGRKGKQTCVIYLERRASERPSISSYSTSCSSDLDASPAHPQYLSVSPYESRRSTVKRNSTKRNSKPQTSPKAPKKGNYTRPRTQTLEKLHSAHSSYDSSHSQTNSRYSEMDFDPHGAKWQCCCCSLPSGLKILSVAEVIACSIIASATVAHIVNSTPMAFSVFTVCLILTCILMAVSSILLFAGIHLHREKLMYPTLAARGLLIVFMQVFGVSTVLAPHEETAVETTTLAYEKGQWTKKTQTEAPSENVALRLVGLVFGMLFLSVLLFYCIYLVVRCIRYEHSFARMRERRESLIHAGMIDPDYSDCRRTSNC